MFNETIYLVPKAHITPFPGWPYHRYPKSLFSSFFDMDAFNEIPFGLQPTEPAPYRPISVPRKKTKRPPKRLKIPEGNTNSTDKKTDKILYYSKDDPFLKEKSDTVTTMITNCKL